MAVDHENPHEWFTAGEVADLARREGITEVPQTKSGMIKWIKRDLAFDEEQGVALLRSMSRKRQGQNGGGGREYYCAFFSDARGRIYEALWQEIECRERAAALTAEGWFTASDIISYAWSTEKPFGLCHDAAQLKAWLANRAKQRPKSFALDLRRLSRKTGAGALAEYHFTLFRPFVELFAVLSDEVRDRTERPDEGCDT